MTKQPTPRQLDYDTARAQLVEDAATVAIHGIALKESDAKATARGFWETHFPILWCLCVQDSPDNPCPCTGPIVWLPRDGVVRSEPALRRSDEGRAIDRYRVTRGAKVLVDRIESLPVEALLRDPAPKPGGCGCGTTGSADLLTLPAPRETTAESGITIYRVAVDETGPSVTITGLDPQGRELARHVTRQTDDMTAEFEITRGALCLRGALSLSEGRDGRGHIAGQIDGAAFDLPIDRTGACAPARELPLDSARLALLVQWGRIAQPLMGLANPGGSETAKKSCFSCSVLLAGVAVGAGCCVAGNPACCAATGIGGSSFIDGCRGACA
ncbi:hypothetical protein PVW48_09120 [Dinoroseobacter sp. PD6]|uniref:hypothetical protein n=1 Tax=Dinoroseobacter sp. PD6 TaxID=3028384 RepID=UPI00237A4575|nr:hypothetical protein [Dinoroseobacter sp. PD6]MDD9716903.1 hypothetical protein [Dinoroseobacter sp. PD6]